MRLWSIHPSFLDRQGLTATWREGLLAQSVIVKLQNGENPGYANHPQLKRFLNSPTSLHSIGVWLSGIHAEATRRGYSFDYHKIVKPGAMFKLIVTNKQLEYEYDHLLEKLKKRSPKQYYERVRNRRIIPHPMFEVIPGPIEDWEKKKEEN